MGDVRFIGMCWDKCRFLEALSEAGQRWQKIQSQKRDRVRGGGRPEKTHFAKAEEITFKDIWDRQPVKYSILAKQGGRS